MIAPALEIPTAEAVDDRANGHDGTAPLTIGDASPPEWDAYVNAHPAATCYHLHGWRAVFERAFGHRTIYLAARRGQRVVGLLPLVEMRSWLFGKFMVSLPFVNYGGIIADDAVVERALFEYAGQLAKARGLSHVELRHFHRHFSDVPCRQHKVTMRLPLAASAAAMWEQLDRKVRNQARKAEKGGLTVETGGAELIDAFYPVFATNMRDLGTPVYSRRLFQEVFAAFPARTSMFVVRLESGLPVAAGVGLASRQTLEMPWASSLREYRSTSANNLLYWHALQHAISIGATTFDFGRSTPNEGTYQFKEQWGATPSPLFWEYAQALGKTLPDHSPKNGSFSKAIAVWQRLPITVANVFGPHIVRSIP